MRILPNIWQDGNGKISSVSSMHDEHLRNAIRLLRRAGCIEEDWYLFALDVSRHDASVREELQGLICSPHLERMVQELNKRNLKEKSL